MQPTCVRIALDAPDTPQRLARAVERAGVATQIVQALGALDILRQPLLGLFCSVRCPANVILRAHDLAHTLRDAGIPVISGFHSPVERECLRLLLRGTQPIVLCMARSLVAVRVPLEWLQPIADGRLLLLSPFEASMHRSTKPSAEQRNAFAAALATAVIIAHAEQGGKTAELLRALLHWGKPLATVDENGREGIQLIQPGTVCEWWARQVEPMR